jgi:hypothetical protein
VDPKEPLDDYQARKARERGEKVIEKEEKAMEERTKAGQQLLQGITVETRRRVEEVVVVAAS